MKILAVGNSFSQDATRYLEAVSDGELFVRNLYIGGCSLERHCLNTDGNEPVYEYQKDAVKLRMCSLLEGVLAEHWDFITVQQVSGLSGLPNSYEPWLGILLNYLRSRVPEAELVMHRTWAYDIHSDHRDFPNYGRNQQNMFRSIVSTTNAFAFKYGLRVIQAGDLIQKLRETEELFDVRNGGRSLNRDGYHLSDAGRYAAAIVWNSFFTRRSPLAVSYIPETVTAEEAEVIRRCAAKM